MSSDRINIPENEIQWQFIRATGPGGQKVNKTSSAVQLHFTIATSTSLSDQIKQRLKKIAGNRINKLGELVISAQRHRSQKANRLDALQRLHKLIHRAMHQPKKRIKTKVPKAVKQKNKSNKQQHSVKKQNRSKLRDW